MQKLFFLSKLTQGSLATLSNDVLIAIAQSTINAQATSPLISKLEQVYNPYQAALTRSRKSGYKQLCDNKWNEINDTFKALTLSAKALSLSFDSEKAKTGIIILSRIAQLGDKLYNQKLSQRIPYLKSIIVELAKPEFASIPELVTWSTHLSDMVEEYEALCQNKNDDFMEIRKGVSPTALSPALKEVLVETLEYIYAMSIAASTDSALWSQLYLKVADRYEVAKRASSRRSPSEPSNEAPDAPAA